MTRTSSASLPQEERFEDSYFVKEVTNLQNDAAMDRRETLNQESSLELTSSVVGQSLMLQTLFEYFSFLGNELLWNKMARKASWR